MLRSLVGSEMCIRDSHATYQFTGDCPGFYLADNLDQMKEELQAYSTTIYDYNMASNRTNREGFSSVSFS